MTATTLTSELEAVNIMLEACDEAPVTSLVQSGIYPLDRAKGILSETSRVVQSLGWRFNTEYEFPLTRDEAGAVDDVGRIESARYGGASAPAAP